MNAVMSRATTFGSRLREFREDEGLTQEELADQIGVATLSIIRYEKNERIPPWDVVVKMAEALDKTPNDFLPPPRSGPESPDAEPDSAPEPPAARRGGKKK